MTQEILDSCVPLMHKAHYLACELVNECSTPEKILARASQLTDVARTLESVARTELLYKP